MTQSCRKSQRPLPHTPAQLDLFCSKELRELRVENAWLRSRLDTAKDEFRKLRIERDTWKNGNDAAAALLAKRTSECAELQQHVTRLQTAISYLQSTVTLLQSLTRGPQQVQAPGLGRDELTQLLVRFHPDRWAQGQPASALAHEVTITLNAARERLEVRR